MIQQHEAVAEVAAFDFPLGRLSRLSITLGRLGEVLPERFHLVGRFGAEAGAKDVIVERHVLPHGAGVALPAAAADELAVDAGRVVQLGADHVQAAESRPRPRRA